MVTTFQPGDLVLYVLAHVPYPRPAVFVRYTTPKKAIVRLVTGSERTVMVRSLLSLEDANAQ